MDNKIEEFLNKGKKMITSTQFRKELIKIMPNYKWTVHRALTDPPKHLTATGTQSSGFNRMSTLDIIVKDDGDDRLEYESRSSGFGKNIPWLLSCKDSTLTRSLRGLQDDLEWRGRDYLCQAGNLQKGRKQKHV